MAEPILVTSGAIRLPPGFRFCPTDEELICQYLRRKVFCCPLPSSIIPEVDVCKSDPWDLPGVKEEERYFFSPRVAKYPNGNRSNRATISGYWKGAGTDKKIVAPKADHVAGMKKTLVFYGGKPPHGCRTDWFMHEYRLANADPKLLTAQQGTFVKMEDWVVCRVFQRKRSTNNEEESGEAVENYKPRKYMGPVLSYSFMRNTTKDLPFGPSSSSSGSSGITQVSCKDEDPEEEINSLSSSKKYP